MSTKIYSKKSRQTKQHVHTCMFCGQSGSEMSNGENKRLHEAIKVAIHNLNAGNDPKFVADYLRLTLNQKEAEG